MLSVSEVGHAGHPAVPPPSGLPASAGVAARLEEYIRRGGYKAGDKLPSERQFSELLGFSRTAVREGVKQLNQKGLVRSSVGRGLFVAERSSEAVAATLDTQLHLGAGTVGDVMEMRHVLSVSAARLAAARATDADLAALRAPLEEMERDWRAPSTVRRGGRAFYLALARAAHNQLLVALTEPVMALMDRTRDDLPLPGGASERTASDHRRIYEAVAARDPAAAAAAAVAEHLAFFEGRLDEAFPGWRDLPVPARS
jgi:GntR family transcriptional regulator, transcriptional repressor for pyruvate dehydrogenase complex